MKNNRKISRIFAMLLIGMLVTSNNVYASVEEKTEVSNFNYEELTVENIPEQIVEAIDSNIEDVVEVSTKDAEDLTSITMVNDNNTETVYMFSEPVKYIDEDNNEIKFIDNTISEAKKLEDIVNKYAFKSTDNIFNVNYSKKISDGIVIEQGDYSFRMTPVSKSKAKAVKKNTDFKNNKREQNVVEYEDGFDKGEHLQYETVNTGVKESILVEKYDGNNIYEFEIKAKGLVPNVYEGTQIEFVDEKTQESVFTVQPSYIEDSYEGEDSKSEAHVSYDNYYTVKDMGKGNYILTMVIDKAFMESPNTVYPVIIDPTIFTGKNINFESSYVFQNGTNSYINEYLVVGKQSAVMGEAISYIKPTGLANRKYINPDNIISSTFCIKDITDYNIATCKVNLYDSNTTMSVANATYENLKSKIGSLQSSAIFINSPITYKFDVTYLTKQWITNAIYQGGWSQNYGFILRADLGESASVGRVLDSTSMYMVIEYSTDEIVEGIYSIKNLYQNKYLSYNTSNELTLTSDLKSSITQWKVTRNSTNGSYMIRPVDNSNVAINTTDSNFTAGTSVVTNTGTNPNWRISKNKNGSYRMIPGYNQTQVGTALAFNPSANTICLQSYVNATNQNWVFEPVIDLSEFYINSVYNSKNLSLNSQNNTCVATPSQTLDNQRWSFVKQSDGTYMIFNSSGDWATRQTGASYGKNYIGTETTGNNIKMCSNGGKKWTLVMNNDSTYSFKNEDGRYLTLNSDSTVTALASNNTSNQKWILETAKKDICVGGMAVINNGGIDDRSFWVDESVIAACKNIGYSDLINFKKGSSIDVRDMIKRSSIFAIATHGNKFFITCNANSKEEISTNGECLSYLSSNVSGENELGQIWTSVSDLPDNCFATTRLVFLASCLTAGEDDLNFVTALSQKGVQTVCGFKTATIKGPNELFVTEFMKSLGNGNTLRQAIADADKAVLTRWPEWRTESQFLVIKGNTDLEATFKY